MRLWSLHPRYLDARGLTACWREALLAREVIAGRTKGYRRHPQLARFAAAPDPAAAIDAYLAEIHREASRRGYRFDASKIAPASFCARIPVTVGQLACEREHLLCKLAQRDLRRCLLLEEELRPEPHPLFVCVEGGVEPWERAGG